MERVDIKDGYKWKRNDGTLNSPRYNRQKRYEFIELVLVYLKREVRTRAWMTFRRILIPTPKRELESATISHLITRPSRI